MTADALLKKVKANFRDSVIDAAIFRNEATVLVDKNVLRAVCNFLKTDPEMKMNYLVDVLGVDYYPVAPRFEVVYHFYSIPKKHRIRVKVKLSDGETVPTVTDMWSGANWPEREAYDMFGIVFEGHPNLKRIYLADGWEGFPMRKDYPLRGYKDRYNPFGEEKE